MSKKSSKTNWKRMPPSISAGEWLKALGIAAVMGLLACAAVFSLPSGTDDARLSVVINRVMTSNPSTCFSVGGRYYDWIELVNLEDTAVSLEGWRLSDDPDLRGGFVFGDVTLPGRGSLIVYCDEDPNGEDGGEVFCGFKLDSNGELLLLADKGQRRVQALDVPAMAASDVYQRDASGEYSVRTFEQMLASGAVNLRPDYDPSGVTISELMAANRTVLQDEDGDYSDWLELYNGGSAPVSLAGCALSDDDANQRKWMLPDIALQPGEYRLVFASGKDRRDAEGELHANFKLSASGEAVRLYDPAGEVLTYVEYDGIEADASLSRQPDGTMTAELKPTPGFENTELGARRALSVAGRNSLGLYINEIMVSGSGFDWIELYNAGDKSADLSGMGLSDSTTHPRRWQFPEGTILPAGGYMAVALAGSEGPSGLQDGYFSADFALSAGETACLSLPDGTLLDKVTLFDQFRDMSYGRAEGQANFRWFLETTPGAKNADESYERKAAQEKIWSEIEVGKKYTGTVKSLTSYGAFVDIGGVDGMVHVSELSWRRIKNPAEVVKVGDVIDVYVIALDPEKKKISLGYKTEEMNPWNQFTAKYGVGDVARVKIVKMMTFGAFAEIVPGVDGLIHISQIADRRIGKPEDVLSVGQEVDAKIIDIDAEHKRISLSIRALLEPTVEEQAEAIAEENAE